MSARTTLRTAALLAAAAALSGCAGLKTAGRVGATPLTIVRDTVDVPLVTVTNVFEFFADHTRIAKAPSAGIGVGLGGVSPYIGYDMSFFLFKGVSFLIGGVDYVLCRSVWPNHPRGVSPWRAKSQPWGDLYFVNTRALWGDPPKSYPKEAPPGEKRAEESPALVAR